MEIVELDYSGLAEEMEFSGNDSVCITWENRGDEFFVPVKASEATVTVMCWDNFRYIGLFSIDPRRYRVSVYRNTMLYWRGFVVADLYSESFTAPPYEVSIKAVDGFNLLSNVPFFIACCTCSLTLPICRYFDVHAGLLEKSVSLRTIYLTV